MKEELKEVCGFKDMEGTFFEKKSDAEISNAHIKLEHMEKRLRNFHEVVSKYLRSYFREKELYSYASDGIEQFEERIFNMVAEQVLNHFEDFRMVVNQAQEMEEELDLLKEEYDKIKAKYSYGNISARRWWFNLKWWGK